MADANTLSDASQTDLCVNCGREMRPHCPFCGSYRCNALVSKQTSSIRLDGTVMPCRAFRCTRCGAAFSDDQWMLHCSAPPPRTGRRPKQEHIKFESLDDAPPDMVASLEELKRKRGIKWMKTALLKSAGSWYWSLCVLSCCITCQYYRTNTLYLSVSSRPLYLRC